MSEKLKNGFHFTGRMAVWLTALIVTILMTTEAADNIIKCFKPDINLYKGSIPMDIVSWFWFSICISYAVGFQAFQLIESRQMESGKFTLGDVERLRKIILATLFIALYGVALNVLFGVDICVEGLITCYFSTILCFVIGRRAIEAQKYVEPEKTEHNDFDFNNDGVIDYKDIKELYNRKGVVITDERAKEIIFNFVKNLNPQEENSK